MTHSPLRDDVQGALARNVALVLGPVWVHPPLQPHWRASQLRVYEMADEGPEGVALEATGEHGRRVSVCRQREEWQVLHEVAMVSWSEERAGAPARGRWDAQSPTWVPAIVQTPAPEPCPAGVALGVPGGGSIVLDRHQAWILAKWVSGFEREGRERPAPGRTPRRYAHEVARNLRWGAIGLAWAGFVTGACAMTGDGWLVPAALGLVLGAAVICFERYVRALEQVLRAERERAAEALSGWRRTLARTIRFGREVASARRREPDETHTPTRLH